MSTTDLNPGDTVWHREFGPGIIYISTLDDKMCVMHRNAWGRISASPNLTGWERIEIVKPGHVQVRVDDLDDCPSEWLREDEDTWNFAPRVAIRAAKAIDAQRAQNTPPADEPEMVGDGCECWVTPQHMWMNYYGAVEPASQVEKNPDCPKHGKKPVSDATVAQPCPDLW